MKKLSFILGSLSGGGAQQVAITLANKLVEKDFIIELVVIHLDNSKYLNRISSKVRLINLNTKRLRYSLFSLFNYLSFSCPDICIIFDHHLSFGISIINNFIFNRKIKIISRCINTLSVAFSKFRNILFKLFETIMVKYSYRFSNIIICQSYGMKYDLINNYKIDSNNIIVINNPINEMVENRKKDSNNEKDDYLLCIGRLEKQKNVNLILRSFAKLKYRYPLLKLKIAGKGSLKDELIDLSKVLGIFDRIHFLDFVSGDELIDLYRKAKLTLLSSFYEGFPNVLIESIALGTPVISVNCPSGPSEIIVNKVNGILVDSYDPEDFANAIISGLEYDWDYWSVIKTSEKYRSNSIVEKYIKAIDGLIC